jgi:hypothetical protein
LVSSHVLQVLDVSCFGPLKAAYRRECDAFHARFHSKGAVLQKDDVVRLSGAAWKDSFTIANVTAGFKRCGMWPFNRDAVPKRLLQPASRFKPANANNKGTGRARARGHVSSLF